MFEIEIKAKLNNLDEFKKLIVSHGAVAHKTVRESDRYFNHPSRDFAQSDEALRVRIEGSRAALTYKGPKIGTRSKTRFEAEVEISDASVMHTILEKLGFTEVLCVEKERTVYDFGSIIICADRVDNLGEFAELEKIGEDRETIENELFALAQKLGLTEFERRSYLEMLLEKTT